MTSDAFASGFFLRCNAAHTSLTSAYLRAVFRRDWEINGVERSGSTVWRVNTLSAKRVQFFMSRYLPDSWHYDGEAILIQRNGRVHSVVIYASSSTFGPSLVLVSSERGTSKEIASILAELRARAQRPLVAYVIDGKIEDIQRF